MIMPIAAEKELPALPRLLVFEDLKTQGIRLSRRQVDRLETDGKFPKRVLIGENRVGWIATEIVEYVSAAIAARALAVGHLGSQGRRKHDQRKRQARPARVAPMLGAARTAKARMPREA
jgi:predicted DNA-binding transcriptional regulator AlpA